MTQFAFSKPRSWAEAYIPLVLWAIFIFTLSAQQSLPGVSSSVGDFLFKKIAHITVYGILYLLTFRTLYYHLDESYKKYWYLPLIVCFMYALTDEIHQSFVPLRTPSLKDLGFDMLGVSIVFLRQYRYI